MNRALPALSLSLLLALGAAAATAAPLRVELVGTPVAAAGISGARAEPVTLAADRSGHAVYGLFSVERRDNPCYLALRTEDVNDAAAKDGTIRNRCGDQPTSNELGVAFEDRSVHGARVFMTGIRVCMNAAGTRVKGLQIRGRRIADDGALLELDHGSSALGDGGNQRITTITEPRDERSNCARDGWQRWVDCPQPDQVVTALIAHFERGNAPRSLSGVGLQCRQLRVAAAR